jgi:glycosyltransferase involved in cell wall biosynthesis
MIHDIQNIVYIVNVDWFFISHRLPLALEAKKKGYVVSIVTSDTGRFKELQSYGFKLYDLKVDRSGTNPFKEFIFILKLAILLRTIKPSVIHNITLKMSIYGSIAARFVKTSKTINAISGLGYNFTTNRRTWSQRIVHVLMKFAFINRGLTFIFQNPNDLLLFQNLNLVKGNRFCIIKGVGVDLDVFKCAKRNLKGNVNFILTARMLKDKGVLEYINASMIVAMKYPESRFILAGDIDEENPASFSEDDLNIALSGTDVKWLGHQNDILNLLKDADVMVFPSYREGLPKSLIEAAAMGLPILTTNAIGCRECVDEGVNGFLVPVGNANILAEKMIYLIENPDVIINMGKASRIKAENEFSLTSVLEKTFELYE